MQSRRTRMLWTTLSITLLLLVFGTGTVWAQGPSPLGEYRELPGMGSRTAVWIAAQLHLNFAAFVLAVPMFALVIEFMGWRSKEQRFDRLAHEMARLLPPAFSITATLGALMVFLLFTLYPTFMGYLTDIFGPTMWVYPLFFIAETLSLYFYYYSWDRLQGNLKWAHLLIGLALNIFGTAILFVADSWATFMMTPGGVDELGNLTSLYNAVWNAGWMPLNVHRLIANITLGALLAGAYAAYRFITAETTEEREFYDWMGYIGNLIALFTMLFLPFAGYYFGFELFKFSATYGVTLMGGVLSWLFIIQAIAIAVLFIGAAYYAWLGLLRIPGSEPQRKLTPIFNIILIVGFMVWATPHTMAASIEESTGGFHPILGALGVMAPKMIAVTLILVVLYASYLVYRRAGRVLAVSWRNTGTAIQLGALALTAVAIVVLGVYGFMSSAETRIATSIWQIVVLIIGILFTFTIDLFLLRGSQMVGPIRWGTMPKRGQYVLIALAFVIVWLMALMGYARSAVRLNWHVFGILEDTSVGAGLPSLGEVAIIITAITLLFFALLGVSFAISSMMGPTSAPERENDERGEGVILTKGARQ